jgi:L-seryl-tRNA(Ser) seleniumtransferase
MLLPVINATGTLLHTNLGRAPITLMHVLPSSNLEVDLETGKRDSRQQRVGPIIARACSAEAALVVNNGAAAVLLVLAALAPGGGVAVARGELIEIGGGFRIPEILEQSGARLVEVGTTNRTRPADYERVVADRSADVRLILKVHQSNFRLTGFTEAASIADLRELGVPLIYDIGSGLLDAGCPWLRGGPPPWLAGEPAARQVLAAGADLVTFSGDKLLGGPQAGIIVGSRALIERCERHPLARALRPGGLVLGALQETMLAYLRRDGDAIPFWRMATATIEALRARADAIVAAADQTGPIEQLALKIVESEALPGAGTLPGVTIPSVALQVDGDVTSPLRSRTPPILARVEGDATLIDLRSVDPDADAEIVAALSALARHRR